MTVTAKFFCKRLARESYNPESVEVTLMPVTRGTENREWATATAGGTMTMHIQNKAAADQFELGKEYLITFEPQ